MIRVLISVFVVMCSLNANAQFKPFSLDEPLFGEDLGFLSEIDSIFVNYHRWDYLFEEDFESPYYMMNSIVDYYGSAIAVYIDKWGGLYLSENTAGSSSRTLVKRKFMQATIEKYSCILRQSWGCVRKVLVQPSGWTRNSVVYFQRLIVESVESDDYLELNNFVRNPDHYIHYFSRVITMEEGTENEFQPSNFYSLGLGDKFELYFVLKESLIESKPKVLKIEYMMAGDIRNNSVNFRPVFSVLSEEEVNGWWREMFYVFERNIEKISSKNVEVDE